MTVYTTTFEIVGEGRDLADDFQYELDSAKRAHFAFVNKVGGKGYCPCPYSGLLRSVLFEGELPPGWKKIGMQGGRTNANPKVSTKIGKALRQEIEKLPKRPDASKLAADLGYGPDVLAIDARGVFFPTQLRVEHPETRHFLRLPLTKEMDFEPAPAMLRAIPENELLKAVEEHNAAAKREREAKAQQ